jgi:regulator of nucleoside diphosphate kinase
MAADALPGQRDGVAASILLGKIEQAMVVSPESLPPSAVGMNCEVEVRDNIKKAVKHLRIGFHGEEDRGRHGVSVLTPIGAALVVLSNGASIDWCTPVKDRKSFTVLRVRHRALKKESMVQGSA